MVSSDVFNVIKYYYIYFVCNFYICQKSIKGQVKPVFLPYLQVLNLQQEIAMKRSELRSRTLLPASKAVGFNLNLLPGLRNLAMAGICYGCEADNIDYLLFNEPSCILELILLVGATLADLLTGSFSSWR